MSPVAPGSLRMDRDASTHPVRSAERSIKAYDRIPVGFEADSPISRNLERGRHYEEEDPTPPSRRNENEETPDEVISEAAAWAGCESGRQGQAVGA